jgi:poly-gamma-glutamate capsule biosynthesis protein CapA/YwtB (metallophosphatase superfamily)
LKTLRGFLVCVVFLLAACQPTAALPPEGIVSTPEPEQAAEMLAESESLPITPTRTPFQPLPTTALPSPTLKPSVTPTLTATFTPELPPEISLLFTGVIVPARCVQSAIDARGNADYIFEGVRSYLEAADLAVGTFNATMSDYAPRTGCIQTFVLVGGSSNADALARASFDVMSVATNHIKNCGIGDCGNRAFFDTLDNLRRVGILPVGAGQNLAEALQPVVVEVKGVRFGFVSLGLVEPLAFAGEDTPGIAVLNEDNLRTSIAAARQVADVVIAMPHMGPEDTPHPQEYQQKFARLAVEAGADLVVGNHTHVVQGMQVIDGVQVFYGLGNFVFDQDWDLAHQQGVMAVVRFNGAQYAGYELIPTHVDGDGTVRLAQGSEAEQILQRMEDASLP